MLNVLTPLLKLLLKHTFMAAIVIQSGCSVQTVTQRPSLAIALETGPLAQQFWDMSEERGWADTESEDDRRHIFRFVLYNNLP